MTKRSSHGFTLVELIMVIVILGILSAVAVPRFFNQQNFQARGFFDQTQAALRYAQKTAISQHTPVHVNVTASSLSLSYSNATQCAATTTMVRHPSSGKDYVQSAPSDVTFAAVAQLCFDSLGRPYALNNTFPTSSLTAALTLGVTGDGTTRTITIERETGYVH